MHRGVSVLPAPYLHLECLSPPLPPPALLSAGCSSLVPLHCRPQEHLSSFLSLSPSPIISFYSKSDHIGVFQQNHRISHPTCSLCNVPLTLIIESVQACNHRRGDAMCLPEATKATEFLPGPLRKLAQGASHYAVRKRNHMAKPADVPDKSHLQLPSPCQWATLK